MKKSKVLSALIISGSLLFGGCSAANKAETKNVSMEKKSEYKRIPIYKIVENDNGVYFLDPSAKYENKIYVDYKSINEWGLDEVEIGEKVIGIFDKTGWELLRAEKVYYNSDYVLSGYNVK